MHHHRAKRLLHDPPRARNSLTSPRRLLPSLLAFGLFLHVAFLVQADGPAAAIHGAGDDTAPPTILLVHSYHPEYEWTASLDQAIREELRAALPAHDLHTVYLDTKRHPLERVEASMADLIRTKYAGMPLDVVIATDDSALAFLRANRDLFGADVPVVFCGVNDRGQADAASQAGFTGLSETVDLSGNLNLVARLHPDVDTVVVVSDATPTSRIVLDQLRLLEIPYAPWFTFVELGDLTREELERRLRLAPSSAAILFLGFWRDRYDGAHDEWEILPLLSSTGLPVYVPWSHMVRYGALGGVVVDAAQQGRRAARIAVGILTGESSNAPTVRHEQTSRTVIDFEVMRSFGLRENRFPSDTEFRNAPDTLYRSRPDVFWRVVVVVIVEAVLIAALYLNITRRRAANAALRASLAEKETLLREVHHRVKNNLQVISSLLTLQTAHVTTPEQALAALADSERRVLSMALVHEMLYGSTSLNRIPAGDYLDALGRQIIENHRTPGSEVDFACHADRAVELDVDTAMPMGLIVSELVSNSAKHGRSPDARLRVSLTLVREGATLELSVHDDGPGFCYGEVATKRTLGLSLVETLVRQLDAELHYRNHDGSTFEIVVPYADGDG